MKSIFAVMLVFTIAAAGTDVLLQYDDGTPMWVSWAGVYRGTWFNTEDFMPGAGGFLLEGSEIWSYNATDCYIEVWNGGASGPVTLIDQTLTSGGGAAYDPPLDCAENFWIIVNTTLSGGGWPAVTGDGSPPVVDHSFYSDDFLTWTPWSDGTTTGDFFIRAVGEYETVMDGMTWGALKSVF
jgi:hypothetical protein